MENLNIEMLKYPIGEFINPKKIDKLLLEKWINDIEQFPEQIYELTHNLNSDQLRWKYRPEGWTIFQIVHHCADSHLNSFVRFKLALTEDTPTIRPYFEDRWAELPDSKNTNIEDSLLLLKSLHRRWVYLLKSLPEEKLNRKFIHPEGNKMISLKENIGLYSWHSRHHLEHIKLALKNKGDFH